MENIIKSIDDKPKSFCGLFGIYGDTDAAVKTYYGLHSLQHRGQEGAGIVALDHIEGKTSLNIHKDFGLVSEVFGDDTLFKNKLSGKAAIGHNRYSTTGSSDSKKNVQPFIVNYRLGHLSIAHNGNLTNTSKVRNELIDEGAIFQTSTDSEIILHLIARSKLENQIDQVKEALNKVEGAYCFLFLTDDKLIAARDPKGFKPLCIGKKNGSFIITSETCALDINSIEYVRDVEPGEIVVIDDEVIKTGQIKSFRIKAEKEISKHCIFEYIYFSRPDSRIYGTYVDKMRRKLGKVLAAKHPVVDPDGDKVIVFSVPDSSNTAAIGYQNQLEKMHIASKLEIGLIRSHYIGRTFILPGQQSREIGVKIKFNTVKGVLEGKTIVVIDDSIVRGTTSKLLIKLLREANPKSINFRVSSPPIINPCYYGMDFPSSEELIANKFDQDIEKIREELGVDTLEFLTREELLDAMVDHDPEQFCTACFGGEYPIPLINGLVKNEFD
ncbi:MAG: amidophosphoribosyltransferase [Bacteroidetes bacterium]|nr:amidophosphoribosyltransferase [Bacteroidota bacterium]